MSKTKRSNLAVPDSNQAKFLDLYYPFHYEVGFAVEREMRDHGLTQLQNVILWTLYSSNGELPRKELEAKLGPWFEMTSSALSKAVRSLTVAPRDLLTITENPQSAREKIIRLTSNGHVVVDGMKQRGEKIIERIISELSDEEIRQGQHFLGKVSSIVQKF